MKKLLYIGNKLDNKKCNISSITILGALFEKEGYKVYYSSTKTNKILRLFDMIATCIKHRKNVDYVLIDTYSTLNFYFALIISQLCRIFKLKYIPRLNGGNLPMRLKKYPFLSKLIFKNAYHMVSPSMFLKEAFETNGYANVIHIPNSIEIDQYEYQKKKFQTIKLLWVRSFSKIYNPTLAVKVLHKLISTGFMVELCMVGPDSDGSLQKVRQVADELNVKVRLPGKLERSEWLRLAQDYNIFINTTDFDNTPVSVIEAMALGLPIITTNVGGIPYLIQDHYDGILVNKSDTEGMVQAILNVCLNQQFAYFLSINARIKVEQFDWDIVKHKWLEILQ